MLELGQVVGQEPVGMLGEPAKAELGEMMSERVRAVPDAAGWWPPFSARCANCGEVHEASRDRLDDMVVYYTEQIERLKAKGAASE